jgi:nitroimidazol reductase NimA-like FMN-containing flavoprotein (pyridoxamine 5'-phosphate oxidase superfamily)
MDAVPSLERQECLRRIDRTTIGRVAVTSDALPAIVPVNYIRSGTSIIFRTEPGGMLARACDRAVVAFEIDGLAPDGLAGWSVLVVGVAEHLDGSAAVRAATAGLTTAAGDGRDQFIAISLTNVTGRELSPRAA